MIQLWETEPAGVSDFLSGRTIFLLKITLRIKCKNMPMSHLQCAFSNKINVQRKGVFI